MSNDKGDQKKPKGNEPEIKPGSVETMETTSTGEVRDHDIEARKLDGAIRDATETRLPPAVEQPGTEGAPERTGIKEKQEELGELTRNVSEAYGVVEGGDTDKIEPAIQRAIAGDKVGGEAIQRAVEEIVRKEQYSTWSRPNRDKDGNIYLHRPFKSGSVRVYFPDHSNHNNVETEFIPADLEVSETEERQLADAAFDAALRWREMGMWPQSEVEPAVSTASTETPVEQPATVISEQPVPIVEVRRGTAIAGKAQSQPAPESAPNNAKEIPVATDWQINNNTVWWRVGDKQYQATIVPLADGGFTVDAKTLWEISTDPPQELRGVAQNAAIALVLESAMVQRVFGEKFGDNKQYSGGVKTEGAAPAVEAAVEGEQQITFETSVGRWTRIGNNEMGLQMGRRLIHAYPIDPEHPDADPKEFYYEVRKRGGKWQRVNLIEEERDQALKAVREELLLRRSGAEKRWPFSEVPEAFPVAQIPMEAMRPEAEEGRKEPDESKKEPEFLALKSGSLREVSRDKDQITYEAETLEGNIIQAVVSPDPEYPSVGKVQRVWSVGSETIKPIKPSALFIKFYVWDFYRLLNEELARPVTPPPPDIFDRDKFSQGWAEVGKGIEEVGQALGRAFPLEIRIPVEPKGPEGRRRLNRQAEEQLQKVAAQTGARVLGSFFGLSSLYDLPAYLYQRGQVRGFSQKGGLKGKVQDVLDFVNERRRLQGFVAPELSEEARHKQFRGMLRERMQTIEDIIEKNVPTSDRDTLRSEIAKLLWEHRKITEIDKERKEINKQILERIRAYREGHPSEGAERMTAEIQAALGDQRVDARGTKERNQEINNVVDTYGTTKVNGMMAARELLNTGCVAAAIYSTAGLSLAGRATRKAAGLGMAAAGNRSLQVRGIGYTALAPFERRMRLEQQLLREKSTTERQMQRQRQTFAYKEAHRLIASGTAENEAWQRARAEAERVIKPPADTLRQVEWWRDVIKGGVSETFEELLGLSTRSQAKSSARRSIDRVRAVGLVVRTVGVILPAFGPSRTHASSQIDALLEAADKQGFMRGAHDTFGSIIDRTMHPFGLFRGETAPKGPATADHVGAESHAGAVISESPAPTTTPTSRETTSGMPDYTHTPTRTGSVVETGTPSPTGTPSAAETHTPEPSHTPSPTHTPERPPIPQPSSALAPDSSKGGSGVDLSKGHGVEWHEGTGRIDLDSRLPHRPDNWHVEIERRGDGLLDSDRVYFYKDGQFKEMSMPPASVSSENDFVAWVDAKFSELSGSSGEALPDRPLSEMFWSAKVGERDSILGLLKHAYEGNAKNLGYTGDIDNAAELRAWAETTSTRQFVADYLWDYGRPGGAHFDAKSEAAGMWQHLVGENKVNSPRDLLDSMHRLSTKDFNHVLRDVANNLAIKNDTIALDDKGNIHLTAPDGTERLGHVPDYGGKAAGDLRWHETIGVEGKTVDTAEVSRGLLKELPRGARAVAYDYDGDGRADSIIVTDYQGHQSRFDSDKYPQAGSEITPNFLQKVNAEIHDLKEAGVLVEAPASRVAAEPLKTGVTVTKESLTPLDADEVVPSGKQGKTALEIETQYPAVARASVPPAMGPDSSRGATAQGAADLVDAVRAGKPEAEQQELIHKVFGSESVKPEAAAAITDILGHKIDSDNFFGVAEDQRHILWYDGSAVKTLDIPEGVNIKVNAASTVVEGMNVSSRPIHLDYGSREVNGAVFVDPKLGPMFIERGVAVTEPVPFAEAVSRLASGSKNISEAVPQVSNLIPDEEPRKTGFRPITKREAIAPEGIIAEFAIQPVDKTLLPHLPDGWQAEISVGLNGIPSRIDFVWPDGQRHDFVLNTQGRSKEDFLRIADKVLEGKEGPVG